MVSGGTFNFDSTADANQGCRYIYRGCADSTAGNFNPSANTHEASVCEYFVGGCLAPAALNYNSVANRNDGSCTFPVEGCTDSAYSDYSTDATVQASGGCTGVLINPGCTSGNALNYESTANTDDGSCRFGNPGCTDSTYAAHLRTPSNLAHVSPMGHHLTHSHTSNTPLTHL